MTTIVVDTSALMAVLQGEPAAESCGAALENVEILISAGTLAECLIVAERRNLAVALERMLEGMDAEVVPVTPAFARKVAAAHKAWGKGVHPAGLNFGDCFAYALAAERGCPLLFVGEDFRRKDLQSAI